MDLLDLRRPSERSGQRGRTVNELEALLQLFRNRGWLSPALASALLGEDRFRAAGEFVRFERAGLLVRRGLLGGLILFRALRSQRKTSSDGTG